MSIDKLPRSYQISGSYDDALDKAICSTQDHWMLHPDAVISVGGLTQTYVQGWSIKPIDRGVQLPGNLRAAWDMVNPLLPQGSRCTSGLRTIEDQRRILHEFFLVKYKADILQGIGRTEYDELSQDLLAKEARVVAVVKAYGQAIAAPGRSKHQTGKAIDTGGASPARRAEIIRMVARANPQLFSGFVLPERGTCVHFEIR
jgi:hypothetical protein